MMNYKFTIKLLCAVVLSIFCFSAADAKPKTKAKIEPGAAQFDMYLPLLKGKRVAFMGNQTSEVNVFLSFRCTAGSINRRLKCSRMSM